MGLIDIFGKKEIVTIDKVNVQSNVRTINDEVRIPNVKKVMRMVRRVNVEWSDGTEVSFDGKIVSVDDSMIIIKDESENKTSYAFRDVGENKMIYASEAIEEDE